MADIKINCSKCGVENIVSEYAEVNSIECRACGNKISIEKKNNKKIISIRKEASPVEPENLKGEKIVNQLLKEDDAATLLNAATLPEKSVFRKQERKQLRKHKSFIYIMWLLFLILAGLGVYNRFYSLIIPNITPDQFKEYGLISIGGLYLICVAVAIKDNMFDGLLSIVVPFYCFYYLFDKSSSAFLRAITAAFLITFGFDLALLIQQQALLLFDNISHWIATANE
jgi:DNA-directed RNA polymerase subunit RPC12/RpoP